MFNRLFGNKTNIRSFSVWLNLHIFLLPVLNWHVLLMSFLFVCSHFWRFHILYRNGMPLNINRRYRSIYNTSENNCVVLYALSLNPKSRNFKRFSRCFERHYSYNVISWLKFSRIDMIIIFLFSYNTLNVPTRIPSSECVFTISLPNEQTEIS